MPDGEENSIICSCSFLLHMIEGGVAISRGEATSSLHDNSDIADRFSRLFLLFRRSILTIPLPLFVLFISVAMMINRYLCRRQI